MEFDEDQKEFSNEQMAVLMSNFMLQRSCPQPHLPAQQPLQQYLSTSDLTDRRRNFQVATYDNFQLMSQLESRLETTPSLGYRYGNHLQKRIAPDNVHSPANIRGQHLNGQEGKHINPESFRDNDLPAHSSDFKPQTSPSYNCQSIGPPQRNSSQQNAVLNYPPQNTLSQEVPKNDRTIFDGLDFERRNKSSQPGSSLLFPPENALSNIGMRSVNELASSLPENFSPSPNESFTPTLSPKNVKEEKSEADQLTSLFDQHSLTHNTSTSPRDNNESPFTQSQFDNAWLLLQNFTQTLTGNPNSEPRYVKKEADSLCTVLVDTRPSSVHSLSSDTGASSAQTKVPIRSQSESWSCMPTTSQSSASKDPSYLEKRRKNNESAKRSREARRKRESLLAMKVLELEEENRQLEAKLAVLLEELQQWRRKFFL